MVKVRVPDDILPEGTRNNLSITDIAQFSCQTYSQSISCLPREISYVDNGTQTNNEILSFSEIDIEQAACAGLMMGALIGGNTQIVPPECSGENPPSQSIQPTLQFNTTTPQFEYKLTGGQRLNLSSM